MNKFYLDANDKNVGSFVVYGKTADKKLYLDAAFTATAKAGEAEVADAFKKGILTIVNGTTILKPVAMAANKIYTVDANSTVAATEWTCVAAE